MNTESFSRPDIEQIVKMVRLTLYNRGLPCGPKAVQQGLLQRSVCPIPSLTTIKRILARHGLTHRRTGHYPDAPPASFTAQPLRTPPPSKTTPHKQNENDPK